MKLVFAIVHNEDGRKVMDELNKNGFSVTKMCSTGGFLKSGNTTLMVGVEKGKVNKVIDIIAKKSKSRKQPINTSMLYNNMGRFMSHSMEGSVGETIGTTESMDDSMLDYPAEVVVGGATVFVIGVEQFEKL